MPWNPTQLLEVIDSPRATSTRPFRAMSDAGEVVVKALGNPEGPHALAREWIGTEAARVLGIPTFDMAIVSLDDDVVQLAHGAGANYVEAGHAIVTRYEDGANWDGTLGTLREARNPDAASRMLVLDTWTRNHDRYVHAPEVERENIENVWLSFENGEITLKAIDHTHCLRGKELNARSLTRIDATKDTLVYGRFPAFDSLLQSDVLDDALQRAANAAAAIETSLTAIPHDWHVPDDAVRALCGFLSARAAFLLSELPARLARTNGTLQFEDPT